MHKSRCIRISEKYFIYSILDIFSHSTIFPKGNMSLEAKLNSIMRLSFLIFIAMILFGYINIALMFIVISIIMNVIFYYVYKNEYK
jgi:hypothetical protein